MTKRIEQARAIAARIRSECKAQRLKLKGPRGILLAIGVNQTFMVGMGKHGHFPHARNRKALAEALGVTVEWLTDGSLPKFPPKKIAQPAPAPVSIPPDDLIELAQQHADARRDTEAAETLRVRGAR